MNKNSAIFALALSGVMLAACDDGSVPRPTITVAHSGHTAKLTGQITGAASWPENYQLVLAGFGESEYALTQAQVVADADGHVSLVLTDIGSDVQTVELCITNRLRRRILTYQAAEVASAEGDTIRLDAGTLDAAMFTAIQRYVFDPTCAQCHGGSNQAAAGLYLTEGLSYGNLVDQPATATEGTRVVPGDASSSVLHKVVNPGNEAGLGFNHEGMIASATELLLIDEWIDAGATN